ncbi:MAG: exodeoxyribonuclease VII small subunit [Candidatus Metalachnospira sp.]|nr:exodeoxyribonuclease VII small subunit [Candidatus Metalachnospira sp.]
MVKKKQNFEEALQRLEEIVHEMETGDLTLDDTVKLYKEGVELASLCGGRLNDALQQVTILSTSLDGQLVEKPFELKIQTEED